MPCPHWRQTRTRLYGLHDMMNGIHCLSWGIDVFAMRYNVIIFSTPHLYRVILIHPFPELMKRQPMYPAPVLEPPYVLFRYHITSLTLSNWLFSRILKPLVEPTR